MTDQQKPTRSELLDFVIQRLDDWIEGGSVEADMDFFEAGGQSILAMRLVAELDGSFGLHTSVRELYDAESLGQFVSTVLKDAH